MMGICFNQERSNFLLLSCLLNLLTPNAWTCTFLKPEEGSTLWVLANHCLVLPFTHWAPGLEGAKRCTQSLKAFLLCSLFLEDVLIVHLNFTITG